MKVVKVMKKSRIVFILHHTRITHDFWNINMFLPTSIFQLAFHVSQEVNGGIPLTNDQALMYSVIN
jgi:ubiquinone biosynthesis protein Coq4